MAHQVLPFIHHLACRPAPRAVARLGPDLVRWKCSCGETWEGARDGIGQGSAPYSLAETETKD